jgi:hypothetical protein
MGSEEIISCSAFIQQQKFSESCDRRAVISVKPISVPCLWHYYNYVQLSFEATNVIEKIKNKPI